MPSPCLRARISCQGDTRVLGLKLGTMVLCSGLTGFLYLGPATGPCLGSATGPYLGPVIGPYLGPDTGPYLGPDTGPYLGPVSGLGWAGGWG